MKIELTEQPKSEILLVVELEPQEFESYEQETLKRVSEKIDIPGFRPGNAPKAFIIAKIGQKAFFEEVLSAALPRSYYNAVKEKNLQVVSRPEIKLVSENPLKYEARAAVLPKIAIKGLDKIKISEEPVAVSEKEIEDVIHEMRRYKASYKPLEREAKKGDRVEIDFEGFDEEGKSMPKTKSKNHPLFIGEGTLVPGFEEQLVGMKKGEKKKFPVKFPKDFHTQEFKNKTISFEATLNRIEEAVLPELNEDFVADLMGEKKTVAEFRESVKKDLHARKLSESRRARENALLEKFLREAKFDVSPMLTEEEIDYMIGDLKRELEYRKVSFENYEKKLKEEKRDLRKEYFPEAEKRVKIRLIINYLFGEMKISVSDEEMRSALAVLSDRTPEAEKARLKEDIDRKGEIYMRLHNNLMLEKLFAKFLG